MRSTLTSQQCANDNCPATKEIEPNLDAKKHSYYMDNFIDLEPGSAYRLIFQQKSDKDSKIIVKTSKYTEEEMNIGTLDLKASDKFVIQELIFIASDKYTNLVFEKSDYNDSSEIYISGAKISKLNVDKTDDLKKTIVGVVSTDAISQKQDGDSSYEFPWLKEDDIILGQIFKSDEEGYISSVTLDIDITKQGEGGSRQYELSLKPVEYDGEEISEIGDSLTSVNFSIGSDIEKYREKDGKMKFPLFAKLEEGEHYMIGINNSKVDTDEFNYLTLKGSGDDNSYKDGSVFIRKLKKYYKIDGDIYFKINRAKVTRHDGEKIISGAIIEDLGKGDGQYYYETKGLRQDMLDIDSFTEDIAYNEDKKIIAGSTKEDSDFTYRIYTVYPFKEINVHAEQAEEGWNKVRMSHSYDGKNWKDFSYDVRKGAQVFDGIIPFNGGSVFYIKIMADKSDFGKSKFYGVKNLRISGKLTVR